MLWDHRGYGGTVECFPVGSRSCLARPLADGTAAGKEHGAARPTPRAGEDPLHLAENDWRIFPYAVGPSVFRWNGEDNHSLTFAPSHAVRISRVHCFRTGSPAFLTRSTSSL